MQEQDRSFVPAASWHGIVATYYNGTTYVQAQHCWLIVGGLIID